MEAKKRLYIGLLAGSLCLLMLVIWSAWYIIFNHKSLLNQVLLVIMGSLSLVLMSVFALGILAMVIMIIRSRTVPWQENVARVVNEWLFPVALLVGKAFRVNQESILQSFISVNNYLVRSKGVSAGDSIMILAPHCLQDSKCPHKITIDVKHCKECGNCKIGELKQLAAEYEVNLQVVTGGTLARKFIKDKRPSGIIAIACERDLSLGIQETSMIPVWGVLNCRPNGPCLNTDVDLDYVKKALKFFKKGG